MKKIIRDAPSDILMIISFIISFMIVMYMLPNIYFYDAEYKSSSDYPYEIIFQIRLELPYTENGIEEKKIQKKTDNKWQRVMDYLSSVEEGNVYLYGIVNYDSGSPSAISGKVLLKQNEEIRGVAGGQEKAVLADKNMLEYAGENNFKISDVQFPIEGKLSQKEDIFFDEDGKNVFINYSLLTQEQKNVLESALKKEMSGPGIYICISSASNIENISKKMENFMNEIGILCFACDMDRNGVERDELNSFLTNAAFCFAILLAVFNCVSISHLWVLRRKKELAVRRAYGYNMAQIIKHIYLYMLKLIGISVIFGVILIECMHCLGLLTGIKVYSVTGFLGSIIFLCIFSFAALVQPIMQTHICGNFRTVKKKWQVR